MMSIRSNGREAPFVMGAVALLVFGTAGCATRKHVRQVIAPVEARVGAVEKENASQRSALSALLASGWSPVSRAMQGDLPSVRAWKSAARRAGRAARAAQEAAGAGRTAMTAQEAAQRNHSRLDTVETAISNLDNYTLAASERVLFAFNRWQLSGEAAAQLDELAREMRDRKSYIIEVHGFTDTTGGTAYNLELSRKRAQAVVRYLTLEHSIPLRRIHVLGAGEAPNRQAANGTRVNTLEARKQSRRVDVKVFTLDNSGGRPLASSERKSSEAVPPARP